MIGKNLGSPTNLAIVNQSKIAKMSQVQTKMSIRHSPGVRIRVRVSCIVSVSGRESPENGLSLARACTCKHVRASKESRQGELSNK